jgi:N-acetylmuramoyl-L-alanine amidase
MSSGHGLHIRGAHGILDEVNEARRVVDRVAELLPGVVVATFHDNTSNTQDQNLRTIVDFHNNKAPSHDLDVSVHFNAYQATERPMGTEVLYVSQAELARQVVDAIAVAGFINRGPKKRTDLYFLNKTNKPAILIEVCFVDSHADANLYLNGFDEICRLIAGSLTDEGVEAPEPGEPEPLQPLARFEGKMSWFGGPADTGVTPSEGLAFIYDVTMAPQLFLPTQPPGTTGLARRLDPSIYYVACRWDYNKTPKKMLADPERMALVRAPATGKEFLAWPADWGPHSSTGRVADLSPGLMDALGISTDDEVEVIYPAPEVPIVEV